jgi:hypothetical protein
VPGIAVAIQALKVIRTGQVPVEERICRPEAAHFAVDTGAVAYVKGYSVEKGVSQVEFSVKLPSLTVMRPSHAGCYTGLWRVWWEKPPSGTRVGSSRRFAITGRSLSLIGDFMGSKAQMDMTRWGALHRDEFAAKTRKVTREVVYFWSTGSVGRVHCHLES